MYIDRNDIKGTSDAVKEMLESARSQAEMNLERAEYNLKNAEIGVRKRQQEMDQLERAEEHILKYLERWKINVPLVLEYADRKGSGEYIMSIPTVENAEKEFTKFSRGVRKMP